MLGVDTPITIQAGFLITIVLGVAGILTTMKKVKEIDNTLNSKDDGLAYKLNNHEGRIYSLEEARKRMGNEIKQNETNIELNQRMIQKTEQNNIRLIEQIKSVQDTLNGLKEDLKYLKRKVDEIEKKK